MIKESQFLERALAEWVDDRGTDIPPQKISLTLLKLSEKILSSDRASKVDPAIWHNFLSITGRSRFLQSLGDRELRYRWAENTFRVTNLSKYSLLDMFDQRVAEYARHTLFHEIVNSVPIEWSYERISNRIRILASAFYSIETVEPRVAIFAENSVEYACCDLACLLYDVFVTPLSVHLDTGTLTWIFNKLNINIVVTDSVDRSHRLKEVLKQSNHPFKIFLLDRTSSSLKDDPDLLGEVGSRLTPDETEQLLKKRPRRNLHETATVMFTSGSTGEPKGVSFSLYNLVTKRFARAAALPEVGTDEIILCYLPFYHTFGRFLEMLGTIYWGGTYVFAGNPSAETLLTRLPQVQPTGLISIPLRWAQIREECLRKIDEYSKKGQQEIAFREVIGNRLRWGLSAAGYLDSIVFRFFHRFGVQLCSGFGMTEATGGITMTPPGEYHDKSVGIPLPGIKTRLSNIGELFIAGPYVASYLKEQKSASRLKVLQKNCADQWIATGDIFKMLPNGHFMIVDRVKDIYKNNKGQTIAPLRVEQKFIGVPGIKRTFLIGDGRDYNVLLIVPDLEDPVLKAFSNDENSRTYFHQITAAANQELAPFERVVNIAILDRDFESARGELTPKGSLRRKNIEKNFSSIINGLYQSNYVELKFDELRIHIPHWFFRDQGILAGDILVQKDGLFNSSTGRSLPINKQSDTDTILIGNLEYQIYNGIIDLGLFTRQPRLWIGNPALIAFSPCKEGWDLPLKSVSEQVFLPWRKTSYSLVESSPMLSKIKDQLLIKVNELVIHSLFVKLEIALQSVKKLGNVLNEADDRIAAVIRRRLEALARHPEEEIRSLAYRILLLDEPIMDYSKVFPAFVQSRLPFLNEASIEILARTHLEKRHLEALRQRLQSYRTQLTWPATTVTRQQFEKIFRLLVNFTQHQPEYYSTVRSELSSWILHKADRKLALSAKRHLKDLVEWFESKLEKETLKYKPSVWSSKIVFDEDISSLEIVRLKKVLIGTTFLKQSVLLAFDVDSFELDQISSEGIWISRIQSQHQNYIYRVSINTTSGKHFDLLMILREDFRKTSVQETKYWMISIAGHPYGLPVLPRFGCYRPELAAMSLAYLNELTVWEKIREISSERYLDTSFPKPHSLQKLFIRAMATFFTGWCNSGYRIVSGAVTPDSIVVPEPDYNEAATILSLTGWQPYINTISLIRPLIQNFYRKTVAHYPWCGKFLNYSWILDACIEGLGMDRAVKFMTALQRDLIHEPDLEDRRDFLKIVNSYLTELPNRYFVRVSLQNAIDRFLEWEQVNPHATPSAREEIISELYRLYRIDRFPEIAHYYLYRHTYFTKSNAHVQEVFDCLLNRMFHNSNIPATQMVELTDLQATLTDTIDRNVFSRLVFPRALRPQQLELLTIGDNERKQVIVRSQIMDKYGESYIVREPIEPAEIGQLFRLFIRENFPGTISEQDHYFIATDSQDRIVGGTSYKIQSKEVVHLEGVVVSTPLKGKGLGSALLEDFCIRMASLGIKVVKTHFFLREFCTSRGFKVDKRWGGLVRFLSPMTLETRGAETVS